MKNELSKKYIRTQFEKINRNTIDENMSYVYIQKAPVFSTSEEVETFLCDQSGVIRKHLIHFIYKYKEHIRKIPLLGKIMIKRKNDMIKRASEGLNSKKVVDIENIIGMYSHDFIIAAYQMLLERMPDAAGFDNFRRVVYQGASNGAIAYMIINSEEFNSRYQVRNINQYKMEFTKYIRKQRLIRIPILGKLINVLLIPSQINLLINHLDNSEIRINNAIVNVETNRIARENNMLSYIDTIEKSTKSTSIKVEKIDRDITQIEYNINRYIDERNQNIENIVDKYTQIACAVEKYDTSNVEQNINAINEQLSNQNSMALRGLEIATSISEKIDFIPSFIAQNNLKNKTVITSIPGGILAVQVGDFIMGIPSEEWGLAMFLSLNGHFEPGSEKLFCSLIKEGMTVIDVGANLGIYTLHALRAGCKVYSYEPTPSTYDLLNQNIKANGFAESQKAHIYNLAVGDREHTTSFSICQGMCGHNHISKENVSNNIIDINVVSLDHHLTVSDKVDFIKIDVEGEEYNVLKGMQQIIKNNPQIMILIEFAPSHLERAGIKPKDLLYLIREYGLTIMRVDDNAGITSEVSDVELLKEVSINLLLIHDKIRRV